MNGKTNGWKFEEEQNVYSLKGFSFEKASQKLCVNNKGGEELHFTVE